MWEAYIYKTIEITWISSAVTSSRWLDKLGEQVADVLEYGHNEEGVNDIGGVRRRLGGSVVVCPALVLDHPCRHHSVGNQTKLLSNSSPDKLSFSQATLVNFVFWGKPKRPTSVRSTLSPTPSCSSRRSRGHLLGLKASWDSPKQLWSRHLSVFCCLSFWRLHDWCQLFFSLRPFPVDEPVSSFRLQTGFKVWEWYCLEEEDHRSSHLVSILRCFRSPLETPVSPQSGYIGSFPLYVRSFDDRCARRGKRPLATGVLCVQHAHNTSLGSLSAASADGGGRRNWEVVADGRFNSRIRYHLAFTGCFALGKCPHKSWLWVVLFRFDNWLLKDTPCL